MKFEEVKVTSMLEDSPQRAMQIWRTVLLQRNTYRRLTINGLGRMKKLVPVKNLNQISIDGQLSVTKKLVETPNPCTLREIKIDMMVILGKKREIEIEIEWKRDGRATEF